jgi:hypothetical protein
MFEIIHGPVMHLVLIGKDNEDCLISDDHKLPLHDWSKIASHPAFLTYTEAILLEYRFISILFWQRQTTTGIEVFSKIRGGLCE